jgi:hypothetical protein
LKTFILIYVAQDFREVVVLHYPRSALHLSCILCALAGSVGIIFASLFSIQSATNAKSAPPTEFSRRAPELVEMLGRSPILVGFEPIAIDLPCDREELGRYISWLAAPGPDEFASPSRSRKLHTGRLVAISGGTPGWIVNQKSTNENHVKLGEKDFLTTWRGVEAAATASGER